MPNGLVFLGFWSGAVAGSNAGAAFFTLINLWENDGRDAEDVAVTVAVVGGAGDASDGDTVDIASGCCCAVSVETTPS